LVVCGQVVVEAAVELLLQVKVAVAAVVHPTCGLQHVTSSIMERYRAMVEQVAQLQVLMQVEVEVGEEESSGSSLRHLTPLLEQSQSVAVLVVQEAVQAEQVLQELMAL
jgi:hypothetical protein